MAILRNCFAFTTHSQERVIWLTQALRLAYFHQQTMTGSSAPEAHRAANNTDITYFGERTKSLTLGTKTLCWKFNVADVSQPILGADFLRHHGLLVDVRRRRLINAETIETTEAFAVSDKVPTMSVVKCSSAAQDFELLIDERPALTCPTF